MATSTMFGQGPQPTSSATPSSPAFTPAAVAPIAAPITGGNSFLSSLLPGFDNLTTSVTDNIQSLLSGLPSTSQARTTNAYWGSGAGTPAGGTGTAGDINSFIGARGTDLYGQQAAANQQTGLQDLLQTIGSYSAPALQAQSQANQVNQFGQNLAQGASQFGQNLTQQQQAQSFAQEQAAYTTSPEYLQMMANLKNYGTTGGAPEKTIGLNKVPVDPNNTSIGYIDNFGNYHSGWAGSVG